jgi:hypothetical protein
MQGEVVHDEHRQRLGSDAERKHIGSDAEEQADVALDEDLALDPEHSERVKGAAGLGIQAASPEDGDYGGEGGV